MTCLPWADVNCFLFLQFLSLFAFPTNMKEVLTTLYIIVLVYQVVAPPPPNNVPVQSNQPAAPVPVNNVNQRNDVPAPQQANQQLPNNPQPPQNQPQQNQQNANNAPPPQPPHQQVVNNQPPAQQPNQPPVNNQAHQQQQAGNQPPPQERPVDAMTQLATHPSCVADVQRLCKSLPADESGKEREIRHNFEVLDCFNSYEGDAAPPSPTCQSVSLSSIHIHFYYFIFCDCLVRSERLIIIFILFRRCQKAVSNYVRCTMYIKSYLCSFFVVDIRLQETTDSR